MNIQTFHFNIHNMNLNIDVKFKVIFKEGKRWSVILTRSTFVRERDDATHARTWITFQRLWGREEFAVCLLLARFDGRLQQRILKFDGRVEIMRVV